jgi:small conductance mechanosensitive channel
MVVSPSVSELISKYTVLLGRIGEFVLVTLIVYVFGRLVVQPLVSWGFARWDLEQTLERTIEKFLGAGIVVGSVVVGAWAAGFGGLLGGSALIFAALTLAVGFAAQDVLSNFVAGVFIVQDPNFNIDDWIEWDGRAGFISDIGFRVTRIRTFDNETVTVPNTELATTSVTNRMSNEMLRISYTVGIGYTDDIDAATEILLDVAGEHGEILEEPEPTVRVADLADTAILLQSRFWIADPDREDFSETRSQYIQTVTERFRAADVDLSTTSQHELAGELTVHEAPPKP